MECPECDGVGLGMDCSSCDGEGYEECSLGHEHECDRCGGEGRYACIACDGSGEIEEEVEN